MKHESLADIVLNRKIQEVYEAYMTALFQRVEYVNEILQPHGPKIKVSELVMGERLYDLYAHDGMLGFDYRDSDGNLVRTDIKVRLNRMNPPYSIYPLLDAGSYTALFDFEKFLVSFKPLYEEQVLKFHRPWDD